MAPQEIFCRKWKTTDDGMLVADFFGGARRKTRTPFHSLRRGLELRDFIRQDDTTLVEIGKKTKSFRDASTYCEKKPLRLKIRNICGDESVWNVN